MLQTGRPYRAKGVEFFVLECDIKPYHRTANSFRAKNLLSTDIFDTLSFLLDVSLLMLEGRWNYLTGRNNLQNVKICKKTLHP